MSDEDIRNFYKYLDHKEESELRLIKPRWKDQPKQPVTVFVKNEDEFVDAIKKYDGQLNIYVGINERKVGGNKDDDIKKITCIGHDIDAHDGGTDSIKISKACAEWIRKDMLARGYKEPLVLCSGRGYWVLHKVPGIENTQDNVKRIKEFGRIMKEKYELKGIEMDTTVYNPSRIARVPGTTNVSDKENFAKAFITNYPKDNEDEKLQGEILNIDIKAKTINPNTNTVDKDKDCPFLNYCLMHEVPSGERHKVISRNMSLYLYDHPLKDDLKVQYARVQQGSEIELNTWLASIEKNGVENFPFSCGEMINFQKKYKIPLKCRGCPKFRKYLSEQKSEDKAKELNVIQDSDYSNLQKDVFTALALKDRDKATELIVKQIEKDNHIYTTRDDVKSEMWIYKEGVYVPQGKSFVREFSRNILEDAYTVQLSNAIVSKIEADTFIEHDEFFNTNIIDEVPLLNGILNIMTREMSEHTPEKIFFNKLPINYDESKDCPNIHKHFKSTLKDSESVDVMEEIFGYLLLKEYKIEKAFMFVGYGRNGKSKTIELMKRFIGAENCSSLPLRSLTEESFSLSELFGRMANLAADLSKTDLKETGMVKSLIGRDTIQAHRKYLRDLNFVNYAKMVFAANELPKIYDTTDGFWTKWVLLEFPYKFVTEEVYNNEVDKSMLKIMDPDIIEKLTEEGELSGLLNFALDGLDRLLEKKDFSYSKSTADVKDMWIRKSDSFTAFCYDHLEEKEYDSITKKQLRKVYHKYTKKHKVSSCSDKAIYITLENMFGVTDSQNSSYERIWDGLAFKNMEEIGKKAKS